MTNRLMSTDFEPKQLSQLIIAHPEPIVAQGLWSLGQQFGFKGFRCPPERVEETAQKLFNDPTNRDILVLSCQTFIGLHARSVSIPKRAIVVTGPKMLSRLAQQVGKGINVLVSLATQAEHYRSALAAASNGQKYISPELDAAWGLLTSSDLHRWLTSRQLEIIRLVALGCSSQAIADELKLSRSTIENHRSRTMKRLGVKTSAELVSIASKNGWI